MNAYRIQDELEERRGDKQQAQAEKEEWITSKANELSEKFPKTLGDYRSPFVRMTFMSRAEASPEATQAYESLVWELCLVEANYQWGVAYMMGEVA